MSPLQGTISSINGTGNVMSKNKCKKTNSQEFYICVMVLGFNTNEASDRGPATQNPRSLHLRKKLNFEACRRPPTPTYTEFICQAAARPADGSLGRRRPADCTGLGGWAPSVAAGHRPRHFLVLCIHLVFFLYICIDIEIFCKYVAS